MTLDVSQQHRISLEYVKVAKNIQEFLKNTKVTFRHHYRFEFHQHTSLPLTFIIILYKLLRLRKGHFLPGFLLKFTMLFTFCKFVLHIQHVSFSTIRPP